MTAVAITFTVMHCVDIPDATVSACIKEVHEVIARTGLTLGYAPIQIEGPYGPLE